MARPYAALGDTARGQSKNGQHIGQGNDHNEKAEQEIIKRVEELAKKKNCTMSQIAIAWSNKRVASPIIGFSSAERMREAIGASDISLSEEEEKYLEEPYLPHAISGHF